MLRRRISDPGRGIKEALQEEQSEITVEERQDCILTFLEFLEDVQSPYDHKGVQFVGVSSRLVEIFCENLCSIQIITLGVWPV